MLYAMEPRKGHFLSTYLSQQKLKLENKNDSQNISRFNDLLYRLHDIISRLNEIFVVSLFVLSCFNLYCGKYSKEKMISRLNVMLYGLNSYLVF